MNATIKNVEKYEGFAIVDFDNDLSIAYEVTSEEKAQRIATNSQAQIDSSLPNVTYQFLSPPTHYFFGEEYRAKPGHNNKNQPIHLQTGGQSFALGYESKCMQKLFDRYKKNRDTMNDLESAVKGLHKEVLKPLDLQRTAHREYANSLSQIALGIPAALFGLFVSVPYFILNRNNTGHNSGALGMLMLPMLGFFGASQLVSPRPNYLTVGKENILQDTPDENCVGISFSTGWGDREITATPDKFTTSYVTLPSGVTIADDFMNYTRFDEKRDINHSDYFFKADPAVVETIQTILDSLGPTQSEFEAFKASVSVEDHLEIINKIGLGERK